MGAKIEARVEHHFPVPAEAIYKAWLDPASVRVWMGEALRGLGLSGEIQRIEIEPRVGGSFFNSDLRNGKEARHWGTYEQLVHPSKIVFTWTVDERDEADPSRFTLTIEQETDGCMVMFVHEMDEV